MIVSESNNNIFKEKLEELKLKITAINLAIIDDFNNFIYEYRKLRKEFLLKKKPKTNISNPKTEEIINKEIPEFKKDKILEEVIPKKSLLSSISMTTSKRLDVLRHRSTTDNMNNLNNNNIKHNESEILLRELNEKLPNKSLLDNINYKIEETLYEEETDEKEESIFKNKNFRPPKI